MYGDQDKTTPGNALASQPDTPFHSLKKFGTNFLDRLESTQLPSPILKRVVRAAPLCSTGCSTDSTGCSTDSTGYRASPIL